MAVYDTYREAVIANGGTKGIYTDGATFYANGSESKFIGVELCNPADYLESLESFLASGKRLVSGDRYVEDDGEVMLVSRHGSDDSVPEESANQPMIRDDNRFIIQAAADQVETPEEKEAFDAIDATLQQVEWKHGDECVWEGEKAVFIGFLPSSLSMCLIQLDNPSASKSGVIIVDDMNELSKPETPAEREERERLEAAYDLYCDANGSVGVLNIDTFEEFVAFEAQIKFWLAIVEKTGYRKERKQ